MQRTFIWFVIFAKYMEKKGGLTGAVIKIYAVLVLMVNFAILLWMFKVFEVPFYHSFDDWQRGLWLSQYLGIFASIIILTDYRYPILNGIYVYAFIFPLIAFFQSFGDPLSLFSHSIHFIGFYILSIKQPQIRISKKAMGDGFIIIGLWLILCWILQFFFDGMGANANNISDPYFPLILIAAVIWFGILQQLWVRKAKIQGGYKYKPRLKGSDWPTPPFHVAVGILITILSITYYILKILEGDYFGFLELIPLVGLITAICIFDNWNNLHLNGIVWLLFPLTFVSVQGYNVLLIVIWIMLFSIPVFSYFYRVKMTWNGVSIGYAIWILLILLSASLLYNFGDIERSINRVADVSFSITFIASILWFILLRSKTIDYFDEIPYALAFLPKNIGELRLFQKPSNNHE